MEGIMERAAKPLELPTLEQIEAELARVNGKREYGRALRSTFFVLLLVTAVAVIVAVFLFPVLEIKGGTMEPTLRSGQYIVAVTADDYQRGDVIAFYFNNNLLVKRVIAVGGDRVEIDEDGTVTVNGRPLSEPYVTGKTLGECNVTFPFQVPADQLFVLGDNRAQSVDSRNTELGTVTKDLVVGKLMFRVWPLKAMGKIS